MARGRSGWGLHRAVAGGRRAEAQTHERCQEAIAKLDTCRTAAEFGAAVAWIKQWDWFLRSSEDDVAMRAAFEAASWRCR